MICRDVLPHSFEWIWVDTLFVLLITTLELDGGFGALHTISPGVNVKNRVWRRLGERP